MGKVGTPLENETIVVLYATRSYIDPLRTNDHKKTNE